MKNPSENQVRLAKEFAESYINKVAPDGKISNSSNSDVIMTNLEMLNDILHFEDIYQMIHFYNNIEIAEHR